MKDGLSQDTIGAGRQGRNLACQHGETLGAETRLTTLTL